MSIVKCAYFCNCQYFYEAQEKRVLYYVRGLTKLLEVIIGKNCTRNFVITTSRVKKINRKEKPQP